MLKKIKARLSQFVERRMGAALESSSIVDSIGDLKSRIAILEDNLSNRDLSSDIRLLSEDFERLKKEIRGVASDVARHVNDFVAYKGDYSVFRDDILKRTRPYCYLGQSWGLTWLASGQPFFVKTDEKEISPWIILGGTWETYIDSILTAYIEPGMTILDVGANIGYYTIRFGSLVGESGTVHALEPNPVALDYLRENVLLNGYQSRCFVYPIAAGQTSTKAELHFSNAALGSGSLLPSGGNFFRQGNEGSSISVAVAVEPIDVILEKLERVDLIKIDAEGYEPFILQGALRLIERSKGCSFLLEICTPTWEEVAPIEEIIAPILDDRMIYAVLPETQLVKLEATEIATFLERYANKMANFFICPIEKIGRVERFILNDE